MVEFDEKICGHLNPKDCKKCVNFAKQLLENEDLPDVEKNWLKGFFKHIEDGNPITLSQKEKILELSWEFLC